MNRRLFCLLGALLAISLLGGRPHRQRRKKTAPTRPSSKLHKLPATATASWLSSASARSPTKPAADSRGLLKKLGDASFPAREEAGTRVDCVGTPAFPLVKAALDDPDLEIARRARRCVDAFENGPGSTLPATAARVLARKQPAQSVGRPPGISPLRR